MFSVFLVLLGFSESLLPSMITINKCAPEGVMSYLQIYVFQKNEKESVLKDLI